MNITKNFTLTELTTSREALRSQIGNKPTPVALINLVKLSIYLLQPLRRQPQTSANRWLGIFEPVK